MFEPELSKEEIQALIEAEGNKYKASKKAGIPKTTFYRWCEFYNINGQMENEDTLLYDLTVEQRRNQKLRDQKNKLAKLVREDGRVVNCLEELSKELINVFENHKLGTPNYKPLNITNKNVGIIHITDTHFNECINTPSNKYNWEIAGKRLKKLSEKAKNYFKCNDTKKVVIALTGDLLNSDRRLDEILVNATNRAEATFCVVDLLSQFIDDLAPHFQIVVASVCGNESRFNQDIPSTNLIASDNFDYMIFKILKQLKSSSRVEFLEGLDQQEMVVDINGYNVLLVHGHQGVKAKALDETVANYIARYNQQNVNIDLVLCGHIHQAMVSDFFARGGSLCGGNEWSSKSLNLRSRASQNLHIIYEDKSKDSILIDLQNADKINGYKISKDLSPYNTIPYKNLQNTTTIYKVVI